MSFTNRHELEAGEATGDVCDSALRRIQIREALDAQYQLKKPGNFLFLGLKALKDIEHKSHLDAAAMGLDREADLVTGPHNVLGIDLNEYAAELARVMVWIGELQWRLAHGYEFKTNPVLEPLEHIECRDALLQWHSDTGGTTNALEPTASVTEWPRASVVIGNPPFLGDKRMRAELGDSYMQTLRNTYAGKVPGGADLVCYWFEKARQAIETNGLGAAGLVATNSIRGGKNRAVLTAIRDTTRIYQAWSDEPWVNDGAAVRVSLISFGHAAQHASLDGRPVTMIHADLSPGGAQGELADLTNARRLPENSATCFEGVKSTVRLTLPGKQQELGCEWQVTRTVNQMQRCCDPGSMRLKWCAKTPIHGLWISQA